MFLTALLGKTCEVKACEVAQPILAHIVILHQGHDEKAQHSMCWPTQAAVLDSPAQRTQHLPGTVHRAAALDLLPLRAGEPPTPPAYSSYFAAPVLTFRLPPLRGATRC